MKINLATSDKDFPVKLKTFEVFSKDGKTPLTIATELFAKTLINYSGLIEVWNESIAPRKSQYNLKCLNGEIISCLPVKTKKEKKTEVKLSFRPSEVKFNANHFNWFAGGLEPCNELIILDTNNIETIFKSQLIEFAYFRVPNSLLKILAEQRIFDIAQERYIVTEF